MVKEIPSWVQKEDLDQQINSDKTPERDKTEIPRDYRTGKNAKMEMRK